MTIGLHKGATQAWWVSDGEKTSSGPQALGEALRSVERPVFVLENGEVATGGRMVWGGSSEGQPLKAFAPALHPRDLGDPTFRSTHGVDFCYIAGAMANGIASVELVEAMAKARMLGFFGAAGLHPKTVEAAIDRLQQLAPGLPLGFNLIHSPNEPGLEDAVVDLYLAKGVRRVDAAAYLALTLPLVRYRVSGIHRGPDGEVVTPNQVFAKVSRVEVASKFFAPPPAAMLATLVEKGVITAEQAELAGTIPMAEDLSAEADSGGHTDNRPALCLLPTMLALRDGLQAQHKFKVTPRVGVGGGLGTPQAVCAAFAMGAAYVLTGSINQACQESGSSDLVREMLRQSGQADVTMAPAADMFEMGVHVQVLKRGTMFPIRAKKLYELYRRYDSLEALPAADRQMLEKDLLRCSIEEEWVNTHKFFEGRDPRQNERAERDPKHKMALIFRSYLGRCSKWANAGEPSRKVDYQVWCGPAMGAFNEWVKGTFLEQQENRRVVTVAANLMVGAAVLTRAHWLRNQGLALTAEQQSFTPRPLDELTQVLESNR